MALRQVVLSSLSREALGISDRSSEDGTLYKRNLIPTEIILRQYGHEAYFVLAEEEQSKFPADVSINFTLLCVVIFVEMVVRFQFLTRLLESWAQVICFYI